MAIAGRCSNSWNVKMFAGDNYMPRSSSEIRLVFFFLLFFSFWTKPHYCVYRLPQFIRMKYGIIVLENQESTWMQPRKCIILHTYIKQKKNNTKTAHLVLITIINYIIFYYTDYERESSGWIDRWTVNRNQTKRNESKRIQNVKKKYLLNGITIQKCSRTDDGVHS